MTAIIAKYRILLYALSVTLLLGSWEIIALRYYKKDDSNYSQQLENRNIYELPQQSLSHTLNVLYPQFAETLFLQGVTTGFKNRKFMSGCQGSALPQRFRPRTCWYCACRPLSAGSPPMTIRQPAHNSIQPCQSMRCPLKS